jgi:chaperone required for assembly of F1-ATPase
LTLPNLAAAEAVAAEWAGQGDVIDLATMPMTRLVGSAGDRVADDLAAVQADIVKYGGSDLLCYRAAGPTGLVSAQTAAWDPVLAWARGWLGASFVLSRDIAHVEQPAAALAGLHIAVAGFADPIALTCLHVMTNLTGSALLALAVARGYLSADAGWTAANVDEDFQMQAWGFDREALDARTRRGRDMSAAARLLALIR